MGEHNVNQFVDDELRGRFIKHLLNDIKALELMIARGLIEDDIVRIGSEQEFCLVNDNWRPSQNAEKVLKEVNDSHFTTELARYNLEINLDPIELKKDCFLQVENQLIHLLDKAKKSAKKYDSKVVLTGILPSISKNEIAFDYMTPNPRYWNINDITKELRGEDFELNLTGVDELSISHDSVLFEACNTSFQMHLQIPSYDFISSYNWAQVISGPVLGICTNSPLLLGRELWAETRIALFQQSIDTRITSSALKDRQARVTLGNQWASGTAVDIFKNDIARYKVILAKEIEENSLTTLEKGQIPKLKALNLHNGTIYRWNRACYGVGGGKPHLRIENRYIPSGPSIKDQLANFAFWVGLMKGRPAEFDDVTEMLDFRDSKANFLKAARTGRDSTMHWKGQQIPVIDLVNKELLPLAYSGLEKANIDKKEIEQLLGVVEKRTRGNTGSKWLVKNYRKLRKSARQDDALLALTKSIYHNQTKEIPIHEWPMIEETKVSNAASVVSHIMSTKLFVANENDLAELATSIMEWKNIHHVPVENKRGDLVGLLTWTHLSKFKEMPSSESVTMVGDIMATDVITVQPNTEIKKAIQLMKKLEYGCLPVVQDKHLVGIITIKDVLPFDND